MKISRVGIVGNMIGIPQLADIIPSKKICLLIAASIRPEEHSNLRKVAEKLSIPLIIQPKSNSPEYFDFLKKVNLLDPELIVCNSYSMKLRKDILEIVNYNAINIHWSLLPKNRGPNPTQWAILKGETKTGVTIHYMDEDFDSGDIIAQVEENIYEDDTWVSVNKRLAEKAFKLMQETIPLILSGNNQRIKQDEKKSSTNKRLTSDFPEIDFSKMNDRSIFNLIRAQCAPLSGAFLINQSGDKIYFNQYLSMRQVSDLRSKYAA